MAGLSFFRQRPDFGELALRVQLTEKILEDCPGLADYVLLQEDTPNLVLPSYADCPPAFKGRAHLGEMQRVIERMGWLPAPVKAAATHYFRAAAVAAGASAAGLVAGPESQSLWSRFMSFLAWPLPRHWRVRWGLWRWLEVYRREWLGPLVFLVEQLLKVDLRFAEICAKAAGASNFDELAQRLGVPALTALDAEDSVRVRDALITWYGQLEGQDQADTPAKQLLCAAALLLVLGCPPSRSRRDQDDCKAHVFPFLARALRRLGHSQRALVLLHYWLRLPLAKMADSREAARALGRCPLRHVEDPSLRAWVATAFAQALNSTDPKLIGEFLACFWRFRARAPHLKHLGSDLQEVPSFAGRVIMEGVLAITGGDYASETEMASALRRSSQLMGLAHVGTGPHTASAVPGDDDGWRAVIHAEAVVALAQAWLVEWKKAGWSRLQNLHTDPDTALIYADLMGGDMYEVARLVTSDPSTEGGPNAQAVDEAIRKAIDDDPWLGMRLLCYWMPAEKHAKTWCPPQEDLGPIVDQQYRTHGEEVFAPLKRCTENARRVLCGYLGVPAHLFYTSPTVGRLPAKLQLQHMRSYLAAAFDQDRRHHQLVFHGVVHFICSVRDSLPSAETRRRFRNSMAVHLIRSAIREIAVAFRWPESVLFWTEKLDHELLVRAMWDRPRAAGGDGAALPSPWTSGGWPFPAPPWVRFRNPPRSNGGPRGGRLGFAPSVSRAATPEATAKGPETPFLREAAAASESLIPPGELLPEGAVVLQFSFDEFHDALCWRAFEREGNQIRVLPGSSGDTRMPRRNLRNPGNWQRLSQASRDFIEQMDEAWLEAPRRHPVNGTLFRLEPIRKVAQSAQVPLTFDLAGIKAAFSEVGHREMAEEGHALTSRLLPGEILSRETRRAIKTWWNKMQTWANRLRRQARRDSLAKAFENNLQALSREADLRPLWEAKSEEAWAKTHVIFKVQGPLFLGSLEWLPFGGGRFFEKVASTSTVLSLTQRCLAERRARQQGSVPKHMLSVHWLPVEDRWMEGLPRLHARLPHLASTLGWEVWGLGDAPEANVPTVLAALSGQERKFGLAVIGAHGDVEHGVRLANGAWSGGGADLNRLDLLIFLACSVGQLETTGVADVEGLYAELAAHGCRSVIAARWPIADDEAAHFIEEVIRQYLDLRQQRGDGYTPFIRAEALNRARKTLAGREVRGVQVSDVVVSSFVSYGLG